MMMSVKTAPPKPRANHERVRLKIQIPSLAAPFGAAFGLARHQRQSSDTAGLRLVFAHRPPTQPVFVLWRDVGLIAVADFFVCAHGDECHRWHARA